MIGTKHRSHQQNLTALLLLALASCGGGGGGGGGGDDTSSPVLVAAAFAGGSATPSAGDALVLAFSQPVALRTGALLTDEDVTLDAADTLGDVTAPPTLLSANTVRVTLGAGVQLTPGASSIALSAGNDVVGGASTPPRGGGEPVTINTSDGAAPSIDDVTIADIDDALNGEGPAGGILQVPTNGWELDLEYSDNTAVATSQTVVTADVAVQTSAGSQPAGADLAPYLIEVEATGSEATYRVPSTVQFPAGPLTLTAIVADVSGLSSPPASFSLAVRPFTDALQPFETGANPSQVWFVDFGRDLESYATSPGGAGVQVDVTPGPNGVGDFEDLLQVLGLTSATPTPNVQAGMDSNEVVLALFKAALLADLASYYSGANVTFTLTRPPGSFQGSTNVAYGSLGYSAISVAGSADQAGGSGVLGLAIFDPSNTTQNDNTDDDFFGSRLGVFLHTIVDSGLRSPSVTNFRVTFDPFTAALGGAPVGDDPLDADRLTGALADARAAAIDRAITDFARFTATVTAHECGHSVGLVENGPMPTGLYGDDSVNFPGSANGHIRNASLFPSGATNVMSPGLSYTTATSFDTAFNTLNMAYLREQVFYGN
ncbi:MAG: hypothetical protein ACON4Z_02570 [Planctomycetota bacterium]